MSPQAHLKERGVALRTSAASACGIGDHVDFLLAHIEGHEVGSDRERAVVSLTCLRLDIGRP